MRLNSIVSSLLKTRYLKNILTPQPNIGTLRYALREQVAIKDGCGVERILSKFGTKQLWFHVTQFFSRCGRTEREQEKSLDSSTFLDLILTQGRKFEDIKTNVTRNIFNTDGTKAKMSGTELP